MNTSASVFRFLLVLGLAAGLSACDKQGKPGEPAAPAQGAGGAPAAAGTSARLEAADPVETLVAARVADDLSKPNPGAEYWSKVKPGKITLMAQPMVAPRPEKTTTNELQVQALHDGNYLAFRLRWEDTGKSEGGRVGEFSDALALEFPVHDGDPPPVMMGAANLPVALYHWRAMYQRDAEQGKPTIEEIYPNVAVDMYQHEYKTGGGGSPVAAEQYSPAKTVGNPQSYPKKSVDVIIAEGFSTTAVQENDGASGKGEWKDGVWTLVITRPINSPIGGKLTPGGKGNNIAFAAWQGGKDEVGSRKCVTMAWTPLQLQ
ncbi:MAG: hypothetical protein GMKNLPBB_01885 [Myxococcota bacterium]|nr:hypothetical protein [Myxococcota bacterium]